MSTNAQYYYDKIQDGLKDLDLQDSFDWIKQHYSLLTAVYSFGSVNLLSKYAHLDFTNISFKRGKLIVETTQYSKNLTDFKALNLTSKGLEFYVLKQDSKIPVELFTIDHSNLILNGVDDLKQNLPYQYFGVDHDTLYLNKILGFDKLDVIKQILAFYNFEKVNILNQINELPFKQISFEGNDLLIKTQSSTVKLYDVTVVHFNDNLSVEFIGRNSDKQKYSLTIQMNR